MFDSLHDQGRTIWSDRPTPFGHSVLVVERMDGKVHAQLLVDSRGLNEDKVPNSYPLLKQDHNLRVIEGVDMATVMEAAQ